MALPTLMRAWNLVRKDTGEVHQGQFEAEDVSETIGAAYTERFTLNRQHGVLQFLHGETEQVSLRCRFFNQTVTGGAFPLFGGRIDKRWNAIKELTRIDAGLLHPPILVFFIGDGHLQKQVVIQSITGITYDKPAFAGELKGVTFTLNLREYTEFDIEDKADFDTRYHHSTLGDYYELIAHREYGNPDTGVFLRQSHPTQPNIQTGSVVALPAAGGSKIRTSRTRQISIVFKTAYGKKPTAQRERRLEMLNLRGATVVSHVALGDS